MSHSLHSPRTRPLQTLTRSACLALTLMGSSSWAAYSDTIQFSSADLGSTYVLDSGFTNPVLPVART